MSAPKDVEIVCDRCGESVHGVVADLGTDGFYDMTSPAWSKYRRGIEDGQELRHQKS
jgi:hypothetical protein